MNNEGLEKMKMKVKPNKKISNNEPLERRTEFERKGSERRIKVKTINRKIQKDVLQITCGERIFMKKGLSKKDG